LLCGVGLKLATTLRDARAAFPLILYSYDYFMIMAIFAPLWRTKLQFWVYQELRGFSHLCLTSRESSECFLGVAGHGAGVVGPSFQA